MDNSRDDIVQNLYAIFMVQWSGMGRSLAFYLETAMEPAH